jgi:hypothetical protein
MTRPSATSRATGAGAGRGAPGSAGTGARSPAANPIFAGYFVLQTLAGFALWIAMAVSPAIGDAVGIAEQRAVTDAFVVPDMVLIVVGSVASAIGLWRGRSWAVPATAFTAGAVLYPTVYLFGLVLFTDGDTGSAAMGVMIPPSVLTAFIACHVWRAHHGRDPAR